MAIYFQPKNLGEIRKVMPEVADFLDVCIAEFGAESVVPNLRKGLDGDKGFFYATENGHQIGTAFPEATLFVVGDSMVLGPRTPKVVPEPTFSKRKRQLETA